MYHITSIIDIITIIIVTIITVTIIIITVIVTIIITIITVTIIIITGIITVIIVTIINYRDRSVEMTTRGGVSVCLREATCEDAEAVASLFREVLHYISCVVILILLCDFYCLLGVFPDAPFVTNFVVVLDSNIFSYFSLRHLRLSADCSFVSLHNNILIFPYPLLICMFFISNFLLFSFFHFLIYVLEFLRIFRKICSCQKIC